MNGEPYRTPAETCRRESLSMVVLGPFPTGPLCPKCRQSHYSGTLRYRACMGQARWWWPPSWGCRVAVEHLHVRCVCCGMRWRVRCADAEKYTP